jgi:hypothetical protein
MTHPLRVLLIAALVLAFGWVVVPPLLGPDVYVGRGRVVELGGDSLLTVEHGRIRGYAGPSVRSFSVPSPGVPAHLSVGDTVAFELTVSGDTAAVTALRRMPDSTDWRP